MKARQSKFHSPYSTVFRPEFSHLYLNEDFTNYFEVTVCSSLCAIGLNIPLLYSLGRTDVWNQQVLFINWTFLNYLYTQGEIQQLKRWYQTENWGTDYLMCCLEVEVWLFLKRELKILLKCAESEINARVSVCVCLWVGVNRVKERKKKERGRGWEQKIGHVTNSIIFCHHGCYQTPVPIKVLLHFQCTAVSETWTIDKQRLI